jgi:hypothetical protein
MTRKVLISEEELHSLFKDKTCQCTMCCVYDMGGVFEWFNATLKKQNGRIAINVNGEPIVWGQDEESID